MIDFDKIGKRIQEERKYLRRISQEKMAEDLGMYQADISNLEKAKSGSGITAAESARSVCLVKVGFLEPSLDRDKMRG